MQNSEENSSENLGFGVARDEGAFKRMLLSEKELTTWRKGEINQKPVKSKKALPESGKASHWFTSKPR